MKSCHFLAVASTCFSFVANALPNPELGDIDASAQPYSARSLRDTLERDADLNAPPSRTFEKRATCTGNTPSTRTEWCDYDITTDYENTVVDTGVVREYWWELTSVTLAPDGVPRIAQAINGSFPGPAIYADWGDTIRVHVTNNLTSPWQKNGTTIHWHGIRQNYTNQADGVSAITQCPTPPGSTYTYEFKAVQYGTTWYHSHWALQAWEGVAGPIIINGPASANYDVDAGALPLTDWSYQTADELSTADATTGPPTLDTGLLNGTNVAGVEGVNQTGYRFNMTVTAGTSYRIRLINMAIDTMFKFMIDNHTMTVISNDLVPIEPFETDVLNIAIAQRYDIVVTANESAIASDFWIRAIPQSACSNNANPDNIKGIFHYGNDTAISDPTTTGYAYVDACVDEDLTSLVPVVQKSPGTLTYNETETVSLVSNAGFFSWTMNGSAMLVEWNDPTLLQIYEGNTSFTNSSNLIAIPEANQWVYVLVNTARTIGHPLHLHGHDYLILGTGVGDYDPSAVNLVNPPRRDTTFMPPSGWLLLAFETNNPGAWLMHCHIGWHQVEGLALQFLEMYDDIEPLIDIDTLNGTCTNWDDWVALEGVVQDDDGV